MLKRLHDFENWTITSADDEDVGKVGDFYFDDARWTVRYLVARTGGWLSERSVLISPMAIHEMDWDRTRMRTTLTREQIERAPESDLAKPVSRQWESTYAGYYGYPPYWAGGGVWGAAATPRALASMPRDVSGQAASGSVDDIHLRSMREVSGYHIHALDGEIGHVEDFMADDGSWTIRYLMVDTSNWIGGRTVLISPSWVRRVEWPQMKVHVDVSRETVKDSPPYHPGMDIDREYKDRLHGAYGRPVYWNVKR